MMEAYQSDLAVYDTWLCEKACAKAILLASIAIDLSMSLKGLASTYLLRGSYEVRNEAMYLIKSCFVS